MLSSPYTRVPYKKKEIKFFFIYYTQYEFICRGDVKLAYNFNKGWFGSDDLQFQDVFPIHEIVELLSCQVYFGASLLSYQVTWIGIHIKTHGVGNPCDLTVLTQKCRLMRLFFEVFASLSCTKSMVAHMHSWFKYLFDYLQFFFSCCRFMMGSGYWCLQRKSNFYNTPFVLRIPILSYCEQLLPIEVTTRSLSGWRI